MEQSSISPLGLEWRISFLKLVGDKAYLVHWDPLQSGDLGSHCPLRLKSVSLFGVLLVHLRMNLVGSLG